MTSTYVTWSDDISFRYITAEFFLPGDIHNYLIGILSLLRFGNSMNPDGAPPLSNGSVLDHTSPPPVFETRRGHIRRMFHLWLRFITFEGSSGHLAYHVHKSGPKTSIIIIIIIHESWSHSGGSFVPYPQLCLLKRRLFCWREAISASLIWTMIFPILWNNLIIISVVTFCCLFGNWLDQFFESVYCSVYKCQITSK